MMPFMCDALLPTEQRYASTKYRRLSKWFNPYRQERGDLVEVRAMLLTPGVDKTHVKAMMRWSPAMMGNLKVLDELDDEARPLAQANAEAAGLDDGEAMIRAILDADPEWGRYMPHWSQLALTARRDRGETAKDMAKEFGVSKVPRVYRWWHYEQFDPLTGLKRPADRLSGGKLIRSRFRPTV